MEKKANSWDAIWFLKIRHHFDGCDGELLFPSLLRPGGNISKLGCLVLPKMLKLRVLLIIFMLMDF